MGPNTARAGLVALLATAVLVVVAIGAQSTGKIQLIPQPQSESQSCATASSLVPTLFGDDKTTQIRVSSPDLRQQRVLRTESADRLPAMFESLLSLAPDQRRLAYVTADDEQMDNAQVAYIDLDRPQVAHVIATERSGMLPIRPVWSPRDAQVAFVVKRTEQSRVTYRVLAASTVGGPVLDIGTLGSNAFSNLQTNFLCVTPAGSVTMMPPPTPTTAAGLTTRAPQATPTPSLVTPPPTSASLGGHTRCELPALSQNDPRWSDHRMQPTGESVGAVGCAVTSAAMVLDYWSSNLTPDQLSDCLGSSAVPIYWSRAITCTGGRVSGAVVTDFSWSTLDAILAAGRPAIVGMLGGPVGMHFVVVTSGGGDVADRYSIVDPWNGRSDANLGSYTRRNWTLFQLVDFRSVGPGCGKLLLSDSSNPSSVVGGISDGAWYHGAVHLVRLIAGVPVTVEEMSYDQGNNDQELKLNTDLTLTDNGSYRVIITPARQQPTVLSFTIDSVPPTVGAHFLGRTSVVAGLGVPGEPLVYLPGAFEIDAYDRYTGITSLQAHLDGAAVTNLISVVSVAKSRILSQLFTPGQHSLTFTATNAAGLSASGQVSFLVQNSPFNLNQSPSGSQSSSSNSTGSGSNPSNPQSGNTGGGTGTGGGSGGAGGGGGSGGGGTSSAFGPSAPSNVTTIAGLGVISVFWSAPASSGSSPITEYIITVTPGGRQVSVPATNLASGITSLTTGVSYTFTVTAINAFGSGPPSSPSKPVVALCAGPGLSSVTLTVNPIVGGQNQLSWQGTAGYCSPYSGTISATYTKPSTLGNPTTQTATYPITGASGVFTDYGSVGTQTAKYVLVLKDAYGDTAQATATGS